jgi:nitroimidazol reductase NimA-like FMN-containing flavoprotein (pyridoxamine 5'-phosphate oxidase superfamily)
MLVDGGLELLDEEESRRLLASGEVGRVGITIGALPAIFPVNYRLVDGAIAFRTAPGSKMSAAVAGAVVAFEVDDYGVWDRSGWSVLVVGEARVVDDPAWCQAVAASGLETFADGARMAVVRIEPTLVTGRRLVHARSPWSAQPAHIDRRL